MGPRCTFGCIPSRLHIVSVELRQTAFKEREEHKTISQDKFTFVSSKKILEQEPGMLVSGGFYQELLSLSKSPPTDLTSVN